MNRHELLFAGLVALLLGGCAAPTRATITDQGYQHPTLPYEIAWHNPKGRRLLPADWQVQNFVRVKGEPPMPKSGDEWEAEACLAEPDGQRRCVTIPAVDLEFARRKDSGSLTVATFPISRAGFDKTLQVLLASHVDSLTVERSIAVAQPERDFFGKVTVVAVGERSSQVSVRVSEKPVVVSGKEGHAVVYDLANPEQVKLDPTARTRRVIATLVRTGLWFDPDAPIESSTRRRDRLFPVLMMVVYSNRPEAFDSGLPAYQNLLDRIRIGQQTLPAEPPRARPKRAAAPGTRSEPSDTRTGWP